MQERLVVVKWRAGLHARRAVDLVKVSNRFRSNIVIKKDEIHADAKSIINLMTLEAAYKTNLVVVAEGDDEEDAVSAIVELFDNIEE